MQETGKSISQAPRALARGKPALFVRWAAGPGVLLVVGMASLAYLAVGYSALRDYGISSLTLAILLGALLGNAMPALGCDVFRPGLAFAQRRLLRTGVALYGFNLSVQQIAQVGSTGILVDVAMVCSTLAAVWWMGRRVLGIGVCGIGRQPREAPCSTRRKSCTSRPMAVR